MSEQDTQLSTVLTASGKVALPEMVAVFLSDYETRLYDRKAELNEIISGIHQEISDHETAIKESFSFKEYDGLKMAKLHLFTVVKEGVNLDWRQERASTQVYIRSSEDEHKYERERDLMSKSVYKPIKKAEIKKRERFHTDIEARTEELQNIILQITDMSRKERQVKAKISRMQLEEKGLTAFLNSPEMAQLIKID